MAMFAQVALKSNFQMPVTFLKMARPIFSNSPFQNLLCFVIVTFNPYTLNFIAICKLFAAGSLIKLS